VVSCTEKPIRWSAWGAYILNLVSVQALNVSHDWQALAIKLYSVTVVSMADERTMSVVTWLNSARHSRQHISTVADHVKIRAWHRYNPEVLKSSYLSHAIC
jgi:hypothetical protein